LPEVAHKVVPAPEDQTTHATSCVCC
jgi:hypothetical protein